MNEPKKETVYRFVCDDLGIYEAVERDCPRDDSRRKDKPDGAWLPKVGTQFPGAVSFWKNLGLKKYKESGLRDWHCSVSRGQKKILMAEITGPILYQDEFQIICDMSAVLIKKVYPFEYAGPSPIVIPAVDSRPSFIRHLHSLRDWNAYAFYTGSLETFCLGAALGSDLGLKRIGILHELLRPGRRSSWPHAHKIEEELVYVLKGNPDIWINGKLYKCSPGDAVFFPPGTGLAHTLLNGTSEVCELLVFGEQEDNGDLIYYPCHPDRNEECKRLGYYWNDHPVLEMGPHNGIPGETGDREKTSFQYQISALNLIAETNGGADNTDQIYYKDRDLARALGAKRVALHHVVLPTGYRTSLPHAESHEEEFLYVLKGNPIAWINGNRYPLNEGDAIAFPSGTGILHTFINESGYDVEFIVSGEMTKKENLCAFPLNPEQSNNPILWRDPPVHQLGKDSAFPRRQ
jgi:uncharacterized cupin superfamily protein